MKIYLMRHGLTDFNMNGKVQGITNNDINDLGINQAIEARPYIDKLNINVVYTGTLLRQIHTAKLVCENIDVDYFQLANFNEVNFGDLEALNWDIAFPEVNKRVGSNIESFLVNNPVEICDNFYKADRSGLAENSMMVANRFEEGLQIIKNKYKENCNVLIVSSAMALGSFFFKKCINYEQFSLLRNCCIMSLSDSYMIESIFEGM